MKSTTLKKVLSILVVAVMIIALAACNSDYSGSVVKTKKW